jgi:hypothetical protein
MEIGRSQFGRNLGTVILDLIVGAEHDDGVVAVEVLQPLPDAQIHPG